MLRMNNADGPHNTDSTNNTNGTWHTYDCVIKRCGFGSLPCRHNPECAAFDAALRDLALVLTPKTRGILKALTDGLWAPEEVLAGLTVPEYQQLTCGQWPLVRVVGGRCSITYAGRCAVMSLE